MNKLSIAFLVAFGGFCVWLFIRVLNRRERWAKWTLLGVFLLPIFYVGSFGPWCWVATRTGYDRAFVPALYRPLTRTFKRREGCLVGDFIQWYTDQGLPNGWFWFADTGVVVTAEGKNGVSTSWLLIGPRDES